MDSHGSESRSVGTGNPYHSSADARPKGDNHPFLSESRHAGENGSLSRNVFSAGSGPNPIHPPEIWSWDHYSLYVDMSTFLGLERNSVEKSR